MKAWSNANGSREKARVAVFISDKTGFKTKTVARDKEWHYIMMKGSILQEDKTIANISAHNKEASGKC